MVLHASASPWLPRVDLLTLGQLAPRRQELLLDEFNEG